MAQPLLLARIDGFCSLAVIGAAARFDLDEREHGAASHDQVQLDTIGADVACDDAITSRLEMPSGGVFTEAPERWAALDSRSVSG